MKLIDRDELLETFERDVDVNITGRRNAEEVKRVLQTLYDDIKESPVVDAVPQWIPCSERMPEHGQMCLCSHRGTVVIDRYLGHGGIYEWDYFINDYEAWMPLPEPYLLETTRNYSKEGEEHETD